MMVLADIYCPPENIKSPKCCLLQLGDSVASQMETGGILIHSSEGDRISKNMHSRKKTSYVHHLMNGYTKHGIYMLWACYITIRNTAVLIHTVNGVKLENYTK